MRASICLLLVFSFFSLLAGKVEQGTLRGILTSKGEAWVEVKDDNGYLHRYLAPWNGDAPSKGGGFDAETLELIEELVVGNRVNLAWFWDGHLRLAAVEHEIPKDMGEFSKVTFWKWEIDGLTPKTKKRANLGVSI